MSNPGYHSGTTLSTASTPRPALSQFSGVKPSRSGSGGREPALRRNRVEIGDFLIHAPDVRYERPRSQLKARKVKAPLDSHRVEVSVTYHLPNTHRRNAERLGNLRRGEARRPYGSELDCVVEHRIRVVGPIVDINPCPLQHDDLRFGQLGTTRPVQGDFELVDRLLQCAIQLLWRHRLQPIQVEVALFGETLFLTHSRPPMPLSTCFVNRIGNPCRRQSAVRRQPQRLPRHPSGTAMCEIALSRVSYRDRPPVIVLPPVSKGGCCRQPSYATNFMA